MGTLPPVLLARWHIGGIQLLSQSSFLIFALGHVVVAVTVLAGRRRMALTAMVAAAAVDIGLCYGIGPGVPFGFVRIPYPMAFGTITIFVFEAVSLAVVGSTAVSRRDGWRHALSLVVLAVAVQTWVFAFDAMELGNLEGGSSGSTDLVVGFALAAIALLLPLALGLGWRAGLLLAATCYPFALSLTYRYVWTADGQPAALGGAGPFGPDDPAAAADPADPAVPAASAGLLVGRGQDPARRQDPQRGRDRLAAAAVVALGADARGRNASWIPRPGLRVVVSHPCETSPHPLDENM